MVFKTLHRWGGRTVVELGEIVFHVEHRGDFMPALAILGENELIHEKASPDLHLEACFLQKFTGTGVLARLSSVDMSAGEIAVPPLFRPAEQH